MLKKDNFYSISSTFIRLATILGQFRDIFLRIWKVKNHISNDMILPIGLESCYARRVSAGFNQMGHFKQIFVGFFEI